MSTTITNKSTQNSRLDHVLGTLQTLIFDFKNLAFKIQFSEFGSNENYKRTFLYILDIVRNIGLLCGELSPQTIKYKHRSKDSWVKLTVYNPYNTKVFNINKSSLYNLALDLDRRLNAMLTKIQDLNQENSVILEYINNLKLYSKKAITILNNEKYKF